MRRDPDFFGEAELCLLYIAKKLREALALEDLLTRSNIDYMVETDTYRGGIIFVSERVGAFFYVAPESIDSARQIASTNGYRPYSPK